LPGAFQVTGSLRYLTRFGVLAMKCKVIYPAVVIIGMARLFLDRLTYLE
jgi:hypothetical protein